MTWPLSTSLAVPLLTVFFITAFSHTGLVTVLQITQMRSHLTVLLFPLLEWPTPIFPSRSQLKCYHFKLVVPQNLVA